MKYNITETAHYSLATITKPGLQTVVLYLSVDIHQQQTPQSRAAQIIYTDALISGAGKYNRAEFLNAINILGAFISTSVADGNFTIKLKTTVDALKKTVKLLEMMFLEPRFDTIEVKRIKQTSINKIKESRENSSAVAFGELRNALYGQQDRRYTHPEKVLIEAVSNVTTKDLRKLHGLVMGSYWTSSIAGNKSSTDFAGAVIKKLKSKQTTKSITPSPHQQKESSPRLILKDIPSKQNIDFSIGSPVPITLHHPDYLPLVFALSVLGIGGFQSRLMSTVREEEGLTYGIFARPESFLNEEQGYWRIMTFFAPGKALQGLTSTFREVKKLYMDGITPKEFALFKVNLKTKQILAGDSTGQLLNELHAYHQQKFSLEEIAHHKNRLINLTEHEVKDVIRKYLDPTKLTIAGAGPVATVRKDLEKFFKEVVS